MKYVLPLLLSMLALATPEYVEIWFLSEKRSSFIEEQPEGFQIINYRKIAERELKCIPYGDGCFDPQVGYYEKKSGEIKGDFQAPEHSKQEKVNAKHLSSLNSDLVECDRDYYFDFFCGKASKEEKQKVSHTQVWIDVSSSFKNVDFSDDGECQRKRFVKELQRQCKDKLSIFSFDTSIKQISDTRQLCVHYGSNDKDRLIRWIKNTKAKNLIIVTDISEYDTKFVDFLDGINHKIRGEIPKKEWIASDLMNKASTVAKLCR